MRSNCAALTNWHSSSKSRAVSPGKPTIMLVRMATPGMVLRMRSINFRKISPLAPRFMRFSTAALACCKGMSIYFTSDWCAAMVSSSFCVTLLG